MPSLQPETVLLVGLNAESLLLLSFDWVSGVQLFRIAPRFYTTPKHPQCVHLVRQHTACVFPLEMSFWFEWREERPREAGAAVQEQGPVPPAQLKPNLPKALGFDSGAS